MVPIVSVLDMWEKNKRKVASFSKRTIADCYTHDEGHFQKEEQGTDLLTLHIRDKKKGRH